MESINSQLGTPNTVATSPKEDLPPLVDQANPEADRTNIQEESASLEQPNQELSNIAMRAIQAYQTDKSQLAQPAKTDCDIEEHTKTQRYSPLMRDTRVVHVVAGDLAFASQALQAYRTDVNAHNERLERANQRALEEISKSTQIAREAVETCEETSKSALSANKEVSLAAIQTARQGTESLERIALDAHTTTRQILQSTSAESKLRSEEERRAKRDEQIEELRQQIAEWGILLEPDITQATIHKFAHSKFVNLTYLRERLLEQKQRELDRENQLNRDRTEEAKQKLTADILRSRTEKINLAKTSIEQSLTSFDDQRNYLSLILGCASVVCFAAGYFCSGKSSAIATVIGCAILAIGSYKAVSSWSDITNRKNWLGLYIRALERLSIEPQLTVRSAVQEILNSDLSIGDTQKSSSFTQRILSQIKDELVTGDSTEKTPTIPTSLAFVMDHATRQSLKSFSKL